MEALIVLGSIAALVVSIFVSLEFGKIAAMKGYNTAKYFWWTFFMGPVGMLMVVALPQRAAAPGYAAAPAASAHPAEAPLSDELPDI